MSEQEKIERGSRGWYQVKQARDINEITGANEVVEQQLRNDRDYQSEP